MPKGIAVLGSHPETKMLAPFDDDWLIYACSPHNFSHGRLPRVDQWFELHVPIAHPTRSYPYLRWLEDQEFPVWMRDRESMPLFPRAQEYPEQELKDRFGPYIFTSSIAYIQAKAIVDAEQLGIKQIGLFGIMQASKEEYILHKTGTQQMIWEAKKLGIDTVVPEPAKHLLEPPPETW